MRQAAISDCEGLRREYLVSDFCQMHFSETTKPMALHRDIFWVGKQWAVTGHGVQACNQKQRGQFDIASSQLWDDGVQDAVRSLDWVNKEDFDKAITAARKYYPEPPRKAPAPSPSVSSPTHLAPAPEPQPSRLVSPKFDMGSDSVPAKLRPVWRVRPR